MRLLLLPIGVLGLVLSACSDGDDATTITIRDLAFEPADVTIASGDAVTWEWEDGSTEHSVVGFDFKEPPKADGSFEHTFDEVGSYDYSCSIHPSMTGRITVEER